MLRDEFLGLDQLNPRASTRVPWRPKVIVIRKGEERAEMLIGMLCTVQDPREQKELFGNQLDGCMFCGVLGMVRNGNALFG